jgi:Rrf2 family transcriptional regulator, cysteine metabolism repressor
MKISRNIAYAVQATLELAGAEPNCPVPCSKLAKHGNLPERYLPQVLRQLVTHGILNSTIGVDGGYCLRKSPTEITLLDIVDSFDNALHLSVPEMQGLPDGAHGRLVATIEHVIGVARQELDRLTVADLLESGSRKNIGLIPPVPWQSAEVARNRA